MKRKYIILIFALVLFSASGCKKFLDVVPDERPTEADAFKDAIAAEQYLYSCYSFMPNPRHQTEAIDLMTADEVVTAFEHETFANFPKGTYTASTPVISYWSTLYKGIRQCYILINNVDKVPLLPNDVKESYKAEAKFLIGYYHFLLLRMYGPIVISKEAVDISAISDDLSTLPGRSSYDESVDFITQTLDEAAVSLPAKQANPSFYGRATATVAMAIKARMLLYAASPLFNGGGGSATSFYSDFKGKDGAQLISTNFDKEKWKKAADAAKAAIDFAEQQGYALYKNSTVTTGYTFNPVEKDLRLTFTDRNSGELIWADTRQENVYTFQNKSTPFGTGCYNGVAPTLAMVEQFYTVNGLPIDKDPTFNYANRYGIGTSPFAGTTLNLNLNREPRFNAWIAYHNSNYEIVRGATNFQKVAFRKNDAQGIQARASNYSPTGYLNKKGVNPQFVQAQTSDPNPISYHYSWPVVRLAELYLDYAEALIEYGQDFATAKQYLDKVRTRAGIPTVDAAWAPIGGANDQTTLRSIVRQERSIELYLENHRFWDVRRWMVAEQTLGVKAKGMNVQGITDADFFKVTEVPFVRTFRSPAFYLMPIPIGEINKSDKIVQNPGY
ncbi:MAG: RagB/SusD family nutrient uptake outer membrane protein [Pedobacter sp.]|nr:MAG: RagB/SusD family nutrient uptake outer membrane protein [Pedobacter sp.]